MEPAYLYSYSWKLKAEQIFNYQISDNGSVTAGATFEQFLSVPRSNDLEYPLKKFTPHNPIVANTINSDYPDGLETTIKKFATLTLEFMLSMIRTFQIILQQL